ncbi:hypothetical protein H1235_17275 [Pseudoxanthomonas sp. NC8]|nr:hypothetical protein H1235_17275 [Pseudoxanthomonas sp. NC8]
MQLATLDVVIVLAYLTGIFTSLAQWVSREKAGHQKSASDYLWPASRCRGGRSAPR